MIPAFLKKFLGDSWKTTLCGLLTAGATIIVAENTAWHIPPWLMIIAGLIANGRLAKDTDK